MCECVDHVTYPVDLNFQRQNRFYLFQIAYLDIWQASTLNFYLSPIEEPLDEYFKTIKAAGFEENSIEAKICTLVGSTNDSVTNFSNSNSSSILCSNSGSGNNGNNDNNSVKDNIQIVKHYSLWKGINFSEHKQNTVNTYSQIIRQLSKNSNSLIGFHYSKSSFKTFECRFVALLLQKYNNSNNQSNDIIVSLKKIDEFYQQIIPIKSLEIPLPETTNNTRLKTNQLDETQDDDMNEDLPPSLSLKFGSKYNFAHYEPTIEEQEEANISSYTGYIPFKPSDERIIAEILADEELTHDFINQILRKIYRVLSPYDICITYLGVNNGSILPELHALCNTVDPASAKPRGSGGGSNKKNAPKIRQDLPSINYIIDEFRKHDKIIYPYFHHLFFLALRKGYILSLMSFFRSNLDVNSTIILKFFIYCLWATWDPDDLNNHLLMRNSLKTIVTLLKAPVDYVEDVLNNSYSGCELFFAAWNFPHKADVRSIYQHIVGILIENKIDYESVGLFRLYMIRQIYNCVYVGDRIQYFNGIYRPLVPSNFAAGIFNFFIDISAFNLPQASLSKLGCYSYYSSKGVINPLSRTVDPAGPFLNNKLYRDFHSHFGIDNHLFHPNRATYIAMRDVFFKIKHYMDHMHNNSIGFIVLSPIINVSIGSELYHFLSTFKPLIGATNVLITDLPTAATLKWPTDLIKDIISRCLNLTCPFGIAFSNFLAFMITLNKNHYFRNDPMTFIHLMFGSKRYQFQGLRRHTYTLDNCIRIKCDKQTNNCNTTDNAAYDDIDDIDDDDIFNDYDNNSSSTTTNDNDTNADDNIFTDKNEFPNEDEPEASGIFYNRLRNIMIKKTLESGNENKNILTSAQTLASYSFETVFEEDDHRKKLNNCVFTEYFKFGCFDFSRPIANLQYSSIPKEFMILCILIFSWLLRMGDTHKYSNAPLMQEIAKQRNKIYIIFEQIILKYFPIHYENVTCDDHTNILRNFCEALTLDTDNLPIKDRNEVPPYRRIVHEDKSHTIYKDENQLTEQDWHTIYTGYSYLIIFSNFNYDRFVELAKIIAGLEYPGNYLKRMCLFHGKSMGGKNVFMENLRNVFHACEKIQLLVKNYVDASVPDQNQNKELLGTSFLVNLDEPPNFLRTSEIKTDVNIGHVSNRPILSRFHEEYPITAKFFITSNDIVNPQTADEGWFRRIQLLPIRHTFCESKEFVDRKSSQNSGELFNTCTKYLVCQVFTGCYPDRGNSSDLIRALTILSYSVFARLFYFKCTLPTSFTLTDSSKRQLFDYMMTNSMLFDFINSTVVVASEETTSVGDLHDFLNTWCAERKKSITPQLKEAVKNHLSPYFNGTEYACRIELKK